MFRVFTCLTETHDLRLVALAGAICFLASFAAVTLLRHAGTARGRMRAAWIVISAFASGCGIWATHFIAILAYDPGVVVGYRVGLTILSLLAAVIVTGAGFAVAVTRPVRWASPLGGAIVGAGVACMHYLGMNALELPGRVTWQPDLVIASVVLGVVLGAAALVVAARHGGMPRTLAAATLLTLAIVSLHFTAMGAVVIVPDPARTIAASIFSADGLAAFVACAAVAVLGMCLVAGLGDRRTKQALHKRNLIVDAAMTSMVQGLNVFDAQGRLVLSNRRYAEMYGLSPEVVKPGCTIRELVAHRIATGTFFVADPEQYIGELMAALADRQPSLSILELPSGRTISVAIEPMPGDAWVVTHTDITASRHAEKELERTHKFLSTVIENVPATIMVKDVRDSRYILINKAGEEYLGVSRDQVIGKTASDVFGKTTANWIDENDQLMRGNQRPDVLQEHTVETPGNGLRVAAFKQLPILDGNDQPQYLVTVLQDVTERKRTEARIAHMAHHDPLTGLPNRVAFTESFNTILERASADDKQFAIMCVDVDRFKEVNDVFGHQVGDKVLHAVGQRLQAAAEGAFVARHGGDEFAIIVDDHELLATLAADRLQAALAEEFEIDGHNLRVGVSVGIALYPVDGAEAAVLIGNADAALYRAKSEGRGTTRFFEIDMDRRVRETRALVQELRTAIERGELIVYYQPQARIDGEIIGFEALVRWQHPARGMVPPGDFIPAAEESGLILPLGEWILRECCREAASWPRPLHIAINLSPIQFRHGDLPGLVHSVLLETGLAPSRLELEITEGVLISDLSRALSILRRLKLLGVRVAMDDFGTGYSSLSNLQAFPFDKIKIDRSFVSNLESNAQSATIVRAVIGLGRGLGMPIVAEGVESREQLAFLRVEACDEVQGYFVGKPQPIEAYAATVGRENETEQRPAAVA
jgi:diguanylate cyclase (GGDEF)-like protein/PAS domain S-box-containing protein